MSNLADIRDKAVKEYLQEINQRLASLRIDFEAAIKSRKSINGAFSNRLEALEAQERARTLKVLEKIKRLEKTEKKE